MKKFYQLLMIIIGIICSSIIHAQVPLVFDVENRDPGCSVAPGPRVNNPNLPDPFSFTGGGRVSTFDDWTCRRNEIKADMEEYELGPTQTRPDDITATYSGGTLTVTVREGGRTLTLTSNFTIPSTGGPHPIVIGMDGATGTLSSSLFNGVVKVPFTSSQIVTGTHNGTRNANDPFHQFYPGLLYVGKYNAWSWGVSRLIDGLELIADQYNLDMSRLAVTGCSYAGKMALFAGAFDERVTLTIAQESGGGGINSWRTSQDFTNRTGINVEKIDNTNGSWFLQSLIGTNPYTLPHDHHELIAMIAPRAFLALGNENYGDWLGDESGYKSAMAAMEVWKAMGVEDRFGYDFSGGHQHCQAASSQNTAVQTFVNRFLLNQNANTGSIRRGLTRSDLDDNWQSHIDWTTPTISFNPNVPNVTITAPTEPILIVSEQNTITAEVVDANNDVTLVEFFVDGNKVGEDLTAPYSISWTPTATGNVTISVEVTDAEGNNASASLPVSVRVPQGPYGGTLHPIPGTIQLEEYDEGGNQLAYYDGTPGSETGVAFRDDEDVDLEECTDAGGGYNIGWATSGEWLEYSVDVQGSGIYDLEIRAACNGDGRTISFTIDGEPITGNVAIPNTAGWQAWTTVTVNDIQLSAGEHELRMTIGSEDYVNLNYITFNPVLVTEPPVVEITSPATNSTFDAPATITLEASASDPDGTIASVAFYEGANLLSTDNTSPYTYNWAAVPAGEYTLTAVATDNDGVSTTSDPIVITVEAVQYPYNDSPHAIPGTIEAEEYDQGGEGLAYHEANTNGNEGGATLRNDEVDIEATGDTQGDYNVGYILNGEWLEYTVYVTNAGLYQLDLRMARDGANGLLHIEMDGVDITGPINVPNTGGWQAWETVTLNDIALEAGMQEMRIVFESNYMNLNYVTFTAQVEDADNDGIPADVDCDDGNEQIGTARTWYEDADNDGVGDANVTLVDCFQPQGYVLASGDECPNDEDKTTPGTCGCGIVDTDSDGDGIFDCNDDFPFDFDNDGYDTQQDCDDQDPNLGPESNWYADVDEDGLGSAANTLLSCTQPQGYVAVAGDECPNDGNKTTPGNCGCGATEQSCLDCAGIPNGTSVVDDCGVCGGTNACVDCAGTPNGSAVYDDCGVCNGTNACVDCAGTPNGNAFIDNCNECVGGNTSLTPCTQDCSGEWGGTAAFDACNECTGGNTGIEPITDPQLCIATGLNEADENAFKAFPNPTRDKVYLSQQTQWQLFNLLGENLSSGNGTLIDLSAYPQGMYLIRFEEGVVEVIKE